ncbi:MAG TPA: hypothetical protein DEA40_05205 [Parvularcula sp.]|nr:hypothetical protein [Parvularcula sp.]HBS33461.1 hypothetical protein [Parvularcula sp.]
MHSQPAAEKTCAENPANAGLPDLAAPGRSKIWRISPPPDAKCGFAGLAFLANPPFAAVPPLAIFNSIRLSFRISAPETS